MGFVEKLIIEKVLKSILKKFKLQKLLDYMEKPNEADIGVAEIRAYSQQNRAMIEELQEKLLEPQDKMYKTNYKKSLKYKGDK